jgi:methyl-accepting chemotaxis protein
MLKSLQNIKDGQNIIKQAGINSNNSSVLVNDMVNEINKIAEASKEISFIIELINGISEKTRLLSVNSAIEASRAGEAGKGFAVVATEIRKLAMQTKEASSKISELIKGNEATISSGVNKTYEVIAALKNIDSSIKFMNSIMDRLSGSVQDGRKKAYDVMNISKNFSSSTTENFNFVSTINKYKILLNSELDKIGEIIGKFVLDTKEQEVVRDIKLYSPLDMGKKSKAKRMGLLKLATMYEKEKKERLKNVKSIALYKQKKGVFDKYSK